MPVLTSSCGTGTVVSLRGLRDTIHYGSVVILPTHGNDSAGTHDFETVLGTVPLRPLSETTVPVLTSSCGTGTVMLYFRLSESIYNCRLLSIPSTKFIKALLTNLFPPGVG